MMRSQSFYKYNLFTSYYTTPGICLLTPTQSCNIALFFHLYIIVPAIFFHTSCRSLLKKTALESSSCRASSDVRP
jgi:hypothetical protein